MIVVAILGILMAVVSPKFTQLIAKSREGTLLGNLATLRSALSVYTADHEGAFPPDLNALVPNYIAAIPNADIPAHS